MHRKIDFQNHSTKEVLKINSEELSLFKPESGFIKSPSSEHPMIESRTYGNLSGRGLYLNPQFTWEIVLDDGDTKVLIATTC